MEGEYRVAESIAPPSCLSKVTVDVTWRQKVLVWEMLARPPQWNWCQTWSLLWSLLGKPFPTKVLRDFRHSSSWPFWFGWSSLLLLIFRGPFSWIALSLIPWGRSKWLRREKCPIHNLSRDRDRTPVIYLGLFIGESHVSIHHPDGSKKREKNDFNGKGWIKHMKKLTRGMKCFSS